MGTDITPLDVAARFGVALLLGFLLGLERERRKVEGVDTAGVRTFALLSLTSAIATWMQDQLGLAWVLPVALALAGGLIVAGYVMTARKGDVGTTSEVSQLIALLLGVLCARGELRLAASLAVGTVVLLSFKGRLHALARRIEERDLEAALKFAIVALVVLPLVPDRALGPAPFDVLNPYRIWRVVVLISAIDFASWLLVQRIGREHGLAVTGLLGGLVSSTATTLGFVKRSRQEPALAGQLALGTQLSWTVMFARILVLVALGLPYGGEFFGDVALGIGAMGAVSLGACAWHWRHAREPARGEIAPATNPFELAQALKFGLLFACVLLGARAAELWLGTGGLYLAGFLSGLADVDPITLSMSDLAGRQPGSSTAAAAAIVLAAIANTLVKGGIATFAGAPELRRTLLPGALACALVGAAILVSSALTR